MTAYDALTSDKHRRFVDEYVIDCNGAAAAVRAGYAKGRKATASALMAREDIKAAIAEKQAVRSAEAGDRATRAAARLEAIALMELPALRTVPPPLLSVVRAAAVDLLKLDGMFTEKHEHSGNLTVIISSDDAGLL